MSASWSSGAGSNIAARTDAGGGWEVRRFRDGSTAKLITPDGVWLDFREGAPLAEQKAQALIDSGAAPIATVQVASPEGLIAALARMAPGVRIDVVDADAGILQEHGSARTWLVRGLSASELFRFARLARRLR